MGCTTIYIAEPNPLQVTGLNVYEVTPGQVTADVVVNGTGSGTLRIVWGSVTTTTHTISGPGQYYFEQALPGGTHNICAEMV
jgi:hypothetical protein